MNVKQGIVYFLGIGGIGMSALARFFKAQGREIHGYDLNPTPLTRQLQNEGMKIHYQENTNLIPDNVDYVVYTPAVPTSNTEYRYFEEKNITIKKRAEILGEISKNYFTIAVGGTHGKTSISMLTAHLLKSAGIAVTALVGGISKNYGTNFISSDNAKVLVIEADEFDRSFLNLNPEIAIISSVDADHLDIYHSSEILKETFIKFAKRIKENGTLILHQNLNGFFQQINRKKITYAADKKADCQAENIKIIESEFVFDLKYNNLNIKNIALQIPGIHYIENALAAVIAAAEAGMPLSLIKQSLESFKGVERRFDYQIKNNDIIFIDDYAHHPNELKVTIDAVLKLYPNKKITGIFQPHLYSRTKDFYTEFAEALEKLDEIILLEIYPAREQPLNGVSSKLILKEIKNKNKKLISKKQLAEYLKNNKPEILLTLGAGDIGLMLNDIKKVLKQ